jgi:hypothetical protein
MLMLPQPETQQVPMPRATTAACEVMPPRAVRMPWPRPACRGCPRVRSRADQDDLLALGLPGLGVVGGEDDAAACGAGRGGRPLPIDAGLFERFGSNCGCSSCRAACRLDAQHGLLLGRSAPRRPDRRRSCSAACAVRLPLRVCSMNSLPFSMVNSMSCMSR